MHAGRGVKQADLAVCAPLDPHLGRQVDKVDLGMEHLIYICRELIEPLQKRKVLGCERVATRSEEVKCTAVTEEDCFL